MDSLPLLVRMAEADAAHLRWCLETSLGVRKLGHREALMLELRVLAGAATGAGAQAHARGDGHAPIATV
jgi:hypothetical protein